MANHFKDGSEQKSGKWYRVLVFLLLVVFLVSAFLFGRGLWQGYEEQKEFKNMADNISEMDPDARTAEGYLVQYADLYEKNKDFAGWLCVPDCNVNLPVMSTPEELEYYLHRDFQKKDSKSGTLFLDGDTEDDCMIIYGHNMKNGTMFGSLDNYVKPEFFTEHKQFSFDTLTERREYEVFAVVKTEIPKEKTDEFLYFEKPGKLSEQEDAELIGWFKDHSMYDTGVMPEKEDQILLLSTCSYHTDLGRLVVAARRVN